ncbi:MAG: molecular chaperone DnaJ [Cyanobium sp.]
MSAALVPVSWPSATGDREVRPEREASRAGGGHRRRGFAAPAGAASGTGSGAAAKGRKRRGSGLAAADRGPLGKCPDLEAIVARQRLGLPLAGRLREEEVARAWKQAAAEHHPDRGGALAMMQSVNGARDLLLGRVVA